MSINKRYKNIIVYSIIIGMLLSFAPLQNSVVKAASVEDLTYSGKGSDAFPYQVNMDLKGIDTLSAGLWNQMASSSHTVIFEKPSLGYSWLVKGSRISSVLEGETINTDISLMGVDDVLVADFSYDKELSGSVGITINVSDYFANASIIKITYMDGSVEGVEDGYATSAVVESGSITFECNRGGSYRLEDTGETVLSKQVNNLMVDAEDFRAGNLLAGAYKGSGLGSVEEPIILLGDLENQNKAAEGFKCSWKSLNIFAGFSGESSPTEASFSAQNRAVVKIEERDKVSGRVLAGVTVEGSEWMLTTEGMKGPYYLDYKTNPTETESRNILATHSLYTGDYSYRMEKAVTKLKEIATDEESLLFYLARMREFAGPLLYTLDVSELYAPGTKLDVQYILGSNNQNLYHDVKVSNQDLLAGELSYSKYNQIVTVDYKGYISFDLYNGGFFAIAPEGKYNFEEIPDNTESSMAPSATPAETPDNAESSKAPSVKPEEDTDKSNDSPIPSAIEANTAGAVTQIHKDTIKTTSTPTPEQSSKDSDPSTVKMGKDGDGGTSIEGISKEENETKGIATEEATAQEKLPIEGEDKLSENEKEQKEGEIVLENREEQKPSIVFQSEDSLVLLEGHLKKAGITAKILPKKIEAYQFLFEEKEELNCLYDISLRDEKGNKYNLEEGEYLTITISLGTGYTAYEESSYKVLYITEDNKIADEIFRSTSLIDEKGILKVRFETSHLSLYGIIKQPKEEGKVPLLSQEYTAVNSTNFNKEIGREDSKKPSLPAILFVTIVALATGVLFKPIKLRVVRGGSL